MPSNLDVAGKYANVATIIVATLIRSVKIPHSEDSPNKSGSSASPGRKSEEASTYRCLV